MSTRGRYAPAVNPAVRRNLEAALACLPQTVGVPTSRAYAIPVEDYIIESEWRSLRPELAHATTFEKWKAKRDAIVGAIEASGLAVETISIRAHHYRAWLDYHQLPNDRNSLVHFLRDANRYDRRILKR